MGIVVPISQPSADQPKAAASPPPVFLAMAMAHTHALGKLFEPQVPNVPPSNRS